MGYANTYAAAVRGVGFPPLAYATRGMLLIDIVIEQAGEAPICFQASLGEAIKIAASVSAEIEREVILDMAEAIRLGANSKICFDVRAEEVRDLNIRLEEFDIEVNSNVGAEVTFLITLDEKSKEVL